SGCSAHRGCAFYTSLPPEAFPRSRILTSRVRLCLRFIGNFRASSVAILVVQVPARHTPATVVNNGKEVIQCLIVYRRGLMPPGPGSSPPRRAASPDATLSGPRQGPRSDNGGVARIGRPLVRSGRGA